MLTNPTNRKKVLLCSPLSGNVGGISKWTKFILEYFNSHESCEITQYYTASETAYQHTSLVKRLFLGIFNYLPFILGLFKRISQSKFDIVHICSSGSIGLLRDWAVIKICRYYKVKTVIHFHHGRIPDDLAAKSWEWWLLKKVLQNVNAAIVLDIKSYSVLKLEQFCPIYLLPNPISIGVLDYISSAQRSAIKRVKRGILFAGHVVETKGIYELVGACKEIDDISLNIVGAITSEMREHLLQLAGPANKWLRFLGERDHQEVLDYMLCANIFVLPSYSEGFPNVILEAMACSTPIISTDVGALPEMLNHKGKNCGLIVPPKDKSSLKLAIIQLLNDDQLAKEMGDNSRQILLRNYTQDIIYKELLFIWKNLS
ncbi:MAG: glycosyltransferase family 4 protein [Weeksellaceae bacterium]|nr:glycosyltransferase family 4 protein [Bacteroidota bacterium]MCG2781601.1 glycosyltransferase family 4 protein [Weeksellaceae bacterium]